MSSTVFQRRRLAQRTRELVTRPNTVRYIQRTPLIRLIVQATQLPFNHVRNRLSRVQCPIRQRTFSAKTAHILLVQDGEALVLIFHEALADLRRQRPHISVVSLDDSRLGDFFRRLIKHQTLQNILPPLSM